MYAGPEKGVRYIVLRYKEEDILVCVKQFDFTKDLDREDSPSSQDSVSFLKS